MPPAEAPAMTLIVTSCIGHSRRLRVVRMLAGERLGLLPLVQRLDQEVDHSGRIRPGGDRPGHHEADLEGRVRAGLGGRVRLGRHDFFRTLGVIRDSGRR